MKKNILKMKKKKDTVSMEKYPRPQLKRDSFFSLNGNWNGVIVPYPLESALSGYKGRVGHNFTYEREFVLPKGFVKDVVLLHFGAVDAIAKVYVNGTYVGEHEGGYLPFEFDITKTVSRGPEVSNKLRVEVIDKLSSHYFYGKQNKHPHGMWYTPVTGIWQSVWLESVSFDYIKAVEITPSLTGIDINIESEANDYTVEIYEDGKLLSSERTFYDTLHMDISKPHLWSPEDPYLYDIKVKTKGDEVSSYFGLRTISTKEVNGVKRLCLNGKPFFFHGVLDQGYFSEGIYTPNCEEDYEEDIKRLKALGINTIRKHIKIEPACFYEACDRLGMLVFQDMVNLGRYRFVRDTVLPTLGHTKYDDTKRRLNDEIKNRFALAMEDTLVHLYSFPSVVYYTLFNEGWGQFDSDMLYKWARSMDRTRIIDSTSGWFWQKESDVDSLHIYFKDIHINKSDRPVILSEFGGYTYKDPEHSFSKGIKYGYGKCKSTDELTKKISKLYRSAVIPAIKDGLCGSIYTQATDVENEINGLYTYDRKVCKVDPEVMLSIASELSNEMNKCSEGE